MAEVALWSRDLAVGVPGVATGTQPVAVTYSTTMIPPRSVLLPQESYRVATAEELAANRRLYFYPKDVAAAAAELKAIREDLDKIGASSPPTLEVP